MTDGLMRYSQLKKNYDFHIGTLTTMSGKHATCKGYVLANTDREFIEEKGHYSNSPFYPINTLSVLPKHIPYKC